MTDNRNLLVLTSEEKQDLECGPSRGLCPPGTCSEYDSSWHWPRPELSRDCERHANQCGHHRTLENTLRAGSVDRTGRRASGQQAPSATPVVQARVARRVQQKPRDGSTHWSWRKLAHELGVSKSTVQRILTQARLKPHRLQHYLQWRPDLERRTSSVFTCIRRSMQLCSASTRRWWFRAADIDKSKVVW